MIQKSDGYTSAIGSKFMANVAYCVKTTFDGGVVRIGFDETVQFVIYPSSNCHGCIVRLQCCGSIEVSKGVGLSIFKLWE